MYNLSSEPCHSFFSGKKPKDVAFLNYLHSSHNIFDRIIMHRIERTIKKIQYPLLLIRRLICIIAGICRLRQWSEIKRRIRKQHYIVSNARQYQKNHRRKGNACGQVCFFYFFVVCCFSFLSGLRYLHKLEIFAQTPSTYQRQD